MVAGRSSIARAMRPEGRRGDGGIQGERAAAAQRSVRRLMERRRETASAVRPVTAGQAATQTGRRGARRRAAPPHWDFEERARLHY